MFDLTDEQRRALHDAADNLGTEGKEAICSALTVIQSLQERENERTAREEREKRLEEIGNRRHAIEKQMQELKSEENSLASESWHLRREGRS